MTDNIQEQRASFIRRYIRRKARERGFSVAQVQRLAEAGARKLARGDSAARAIQATMKQISAH